MQENEALYWQHVEDGDFAGAKQFLPTSADLLRQSADQYLEDDIESGKVDVSRIFKVERLGKFVGYTSTETLSGVKIIRTSSGDFTIRAAYEERKPDSKPGDYQDLEVQVDLPANDDPVVREDRRKVVNHEYTGEGGNRTLSKSDREHKMGEITKLIWLTFE